MKYFILSLLTIIAFPAYSAVISWAPTNDPQPDYYKLEQSIDGAPFEEVARIQVPGALQVEVAISVPTVMRVGACTDNGEAEDACVFGPEGVVVPTPGTHPTVVVPGVPGAPFVLTPPAS